MKQSKLTKEIKALAHKVADKHPQPQKHYHQLAVTPTRAKRTQLQQELETQAEQSYDQLDGEWLDWLLVARKYEGKVPGQDRYDVRHNILIELAKARARDGVPIPILRAYRIASLTVALYWRERIKREVKVCVYSGIATEPHCKACSHKTKALRCPYLAIRPMQSLDQPTTDYEGYQCRLLDTVADDNAITAVDLDANIDATRWLLGCPMRLIEIATKKLEGKALNARDRMYLSRYRKQAQKTLF